MNRWIHHPPCRAYQQWYCALCSFLKCINTESTISFRSACDITAPFLGEIVTFVFYSQSPELLLIPVVCTQDESSLQFAFQTQPTRVSLLPSPPTSPVLIKSVSIMHSYSYQDVLPCLSLSARYVYRLMSVVPHRASVDSFISLLHTNSKNQQTKHPLSRRREIEALCTTLSDDTVAATSEAAAEAAADSLIAHSSLDHTHQRHSSVSSPQRQQHTQQQRKQPTKSFPLELHIIKQVLSASLSLSLSCSPPSLILPELWNMHLYSHTNINSCTRT